MKIIINQPRVSYFVGGAEQVSMEHARQLNAMGHNVVVVTLDPRSINMAYSGQYQSFKRLYSRDIEFIELRQDSSILDIYAIEPGESRVRWNIESLFYNKSLRAYLDGNSGGAVVLSYYILDCLDSGQNTNVLYLCGTPKERDDFQGSFLRLYDKAVAISDNVSDYWSRYSLQKVPTVYPGVDTARFSPDACRAKVDIGSAGRLNILYVGRLIERKNVESLIDAVKIVRNHGVNVLLSIVGDGPDRRRLESVADDNVRFIGKSDEPEKYYKNSDIFVAPSRYGDGVQGTILEAMSTGLVCVASDTRINGTLLSKGRGVVCKCDAVSIANAIESVCLNMSSYNAVEIRKYICDNYSWKSSVERLVKEILL